MWSYCIDWIEGLVGWLVRVTIGARETIGRKTNESRDRERRRDSGKTETHRTEISLDGRKCHGRRDYY